MTRRSKRSPAYWRRQVARGRIPADDPRAARPAAEQAAALDAQLAALTRPRAIRHR